MPSPAAMSVASSTFFRGTCILMMSGESPSFARAIAAIGRMCSSLSPSRTSSRHTARLRTSVGA